MTTKPVDFLEGLQVERPELAPDLSELASLYQRKLWHQLSVKIEECFSKPEFNVGDVPMQLYQHFISDFGPKINLLKFAQFAVHVSKQLKDPAASQAFLQSVVERLQELKLARSEEPLLFLRMHVAQAQLEGGALPECKATVVEGREQLEGMSPVDPCVSAAVYYVSSLYYKQVSDYAEFYRSSMMYLAFVSSDALAPDFRLALAVDVSLAALLGEGLYNFAQLLNHPISAALVGSPYQWLHDLLDAFNAGDLHRYDELCRVHASQLNAQPALVENERRLREKITISCLIDAISSLPPESRRIPLSTIAARTKLSVDGVEFLLMKALALHLIEGVIDEVDQEVSVSWVQPRTLTRAQISGLKERLDTWVGKVNSIGVQLAYHSTGLADVA